MRVRFLLAPLAPLAVLALPQIALAQAAAESATILSGTGQGTGSASRTMGGNVAGAMNRATSAIRGANSGGGGSAGGGGSRSARGGGQLKLRIGYLVTPGPDALEGTGAPAFQMSNGATIRTSGKLRQPAPTPCSEACPPAPAPAPAEPKP